MDDNDFKTYESINTSPVQMVPVFKGHEKSEKQIIEDFHKLYYNSKVWANGLTKYRNVETAKCPLDMWVYQEIIMQIKPKLIIETGTYKGGSAMFMADMLWFNDIASPYPGQQVSVTPSYYGNSGLVVTIDITSIAQFPKYYSNVWYLSEHDSTHKNTIEKIMTLIKRSEKYYNPVMVVLDSDHSKQHVARELELYAPFVTPGSYLIVEDTNVDTVIHPDGEPGAASAVKEFLKTHSEFFIDKDCEKYFLTFNPNGYLRRK